MNIEIVRDFRLNIIMTFLTSRFLYYFLYYPVYYYTFEKRYYVFHLSTRFVCLCVCLSVCLSVCHQHCDEMAGLSNTVLSEAITLGNSSTLQHYQDDPFPFPFHMGHSNKITSWAIISKLMNGFTPNLTSM